MASTRGLVYLYLGTCGNCIKNEYGCETSRYGSKGEAEFFLDVGASIETNFFSVRYAVKSLPLGRALEVNVNRL